MALGLPSGLQLAAAAAGEDAASSSCRAVPPVSARLLSATRSNPCPSRGFLFSTFSSLPLEHVRASSSTHGNGEPSSAGATTMAVESEPPIIALEFIAPQTGADGNSIVDKFSVTSGEKVLRTVMNEQKLELYGLYGKVMNCGGGGSCGTCMILDGSDLLNERTDAEQRYLKKVVVQRLPQQMKKKN